MPGEFDTLNEARGEVRLQIENMCRKVCPLLKSKCTNKCMNFNEPRIQKWKDGENSSYYDVKPGYCDNVLISGVIVVEQS